MWVLKEIVWFLLLFTTGPRTCCVSTSGTEPGYSMMQYGIICDYHKATESQHKYVYNCCCVMLCQWIYAVGRHSWLMLSASTAAMGWTKFDCAFRGGCHCCDFQGQWYHQDPIEMMGTFLPSQKFAADYSKFSISLGTSVRWSLEINHANKFQRNSQHLIIAT